eukprot:3292767-Rhodomonas_salina.1
MSSYADYMGDDIVSFLEGKLNTTNYGWEYDLMTKINSTTAEAEGNARDMDIGWLVTCGAL